MQNETVSLTIANPRSEVLLANVKAQLTPAELLVIDCDPMLEIAKGELLMIKTQAKNLEEARFSITRPLDEAKKNAMAVFKPAEEYLAGEDKLIRGKVSTYLQDQERKRREEQAKIDAELRAQREEAERQAAAIIAKAKAGADALAVAAKAAEVAGDMARAAELRVESAQVAESGAFESQMVEQAVPSVANVVAIDSKVTGLSVRAPWKGRVSDMRKFVAYIAANPQYLGLLKVDEVAVNAQAKAMKENCNIDGMQTYQDRQLAIR